MLGATRVAVMLLPLLFGKGGLMCGNLVHMLPDLVSERIYVQHRVQRVVQLNFSTVCCAYRKAPDPKPGQGTTARPCPAT